MTLFYRVGSEVPVDDNARDYIASFTVGNLTGTTSVVLDPAGTPSAVYSPPNRCDYGKGHFSVSGQRGPYLLDTRQHNYCGGVHVPVTKQCEFDPALRCYCRREHTLPSILFLTLIKH